jgi:UPF0271 protein
MAKNPREDLNADAGESFGAWRLGDEERLFPFLTSVNLACGFHAGDPLVMRQAVWLAAEAGVRVGAHPGFPDLAGFGRRDMNLHPDELHAAVLYQLGALSAFLKAEGLEMHHVKPHGALYLRMGRDKEAARTVARAVRDFDAALPLVVLGGPGGQVMREAARQYSIRTIGEAFPDRAYLASGHLAPRSLDGAAIRDPQAAAERAVRMVLHGEIEALDGSAVWVEAQTLCIHGDNPEAPDIAIAIWEALEAAGVEITGF